MIAVVYFIITWILLTISEFFLERGRQKNDKATNFKKVIRMVDGKEVETISKDIKVGDIIRVFDEEVIPADCILLTSYE